MNGTILNWYWPTMAMMVLMLSSAPASAWYPAYPRLPYSSSGPSSYYPYSNWSPPYYQGPGVWRGYYSGYGKPKWSLRARINRFGDYRVDIKLRGVSQNDLHKIWWLYQQYGYR